MAANKAATSGRLSCLYQKPVWLNGRGSLSWSQVPPQWQRLPFFDTSIKLTDRAYLPVRENWTKPSHLHPPPISLSVVIHRGETQWVFQEFISCTSRIRLLRWGTETSGELPLQCSDLRTSVYTSSETWSYFIYYLFTPFFFQVQPKCSMKEKFCRPWQGISKHIVQLFCCLKEHPTFKQDDAIAVTVGTWGTLYHPHVGMIQLLNLTESILKELPFKILMGKLEVSIVFWCWLA